MHSGIPDWLLFRSGKCPNTYASEPYQRHNMRQRLSWRTSDASGLFHFACVPLIIDALRDDSWLGISMPHWRTFEEAFLCVPTPWTWGGVLAPCKSAQLQHKYEPPHTAVAVADLNMHARVWRRKHKALACSCVLRRSCRCAGGVNFPCFACHQVLLRSNNERRRRRRTPSHVSTHFSWKRCAHTRASITHRTHAGDHFHANNLSRARCGSSTYISACISGEVMLVKWLGACACCFLCVRLMYASSRCDFTMLGLQYGTC